ncbi:adhesion G-protein coupled receptor G1-like [Gambusia affinis]|uniref:adhesion G-protein coupled receptor G1-like n=1 Tax=Gambusia affinis TaxID=33528 RepID=UPI001CDCD9DB|nr:adhesion G-protein coupled receptor G1-like [Gambusia affinis]
MLLKATGYRTSWSGFEACDQTRREATLNHQSDSTPQSVISICLRKLNMKWITFYLLTLCFPTTRAHCKPEKVSEECIKENPVMWTRCYGDKMVTCKQRNRMLARFARREVNPAKQAELGPTSNHEVRIPSSALQRIRRTPSEEDVLVVASVINSTLFQRTPRSKRKSIIPQSTVREEGTVLGGLVLFVKAGKQPVSNLTEPIQLFFKHNEKENSGTCVFWQEDETEWRTEGCYTNKTEDEFICSCDRLGFFAVLVNPDLNVCACHAVNVSCITYSGSALSVFFAFISLFIFTKLFL